MKKLNVILFCALAALALSTAMTVTADAQGTSSPAPIVTTAPAAATPVVVPAVVSPAPSPTVAVPVTAAPPAWATDLLATISGLPVVGPYVSKLLIWLGILAAILTTLVAASLSILASLKSAFTWAGLDSAAAAVTAFQKGPVLYWLTYFSNFNAKKPTA